LLNVEFVLGNSTEQLARICPALPGPTLFWLDAHAGAGFFGDADNCPLLEELETCLVQTRADHCILIDDGVCGAASTAVRPSQMAEPGPDHRRGAAPGWLPSPLSATC
jgi:hypothetical protein